MRITAKLLEHTHQEGSKDYTLLLLARDDGKAILVRRWGKVGQAGQFKYEPYTGEWWADMELRKQAEQRASRGYQLDTSSHESFTANDAGLGAFYGWSELPGRMSRGLDKTRLRTFFTEGQPDQATVQPKVQTTPQPQQLSNPLWGTW